MSTPAAAFDPDLSWRLHHQVAVRPEPFGALLYHFGTRKLSFLKNRTIVEVVNSLGDHPDARSACRAAGIDDAQQAPYLHALGVLAQSKMLVREETMTALIQRSRRSQPVPRLVEQFEHGLDAPICLTWELTYACNLACVHCLSSSGKRDPRELTTQQCKDIIDELERMQVFYVNIGGGEPTVRPDFWELVDYATAHHVGVKFSTNGVRITPEVAARLAASDYVDVQISLDGATAEVNDAVRGPGSFAMAIRALENLADAGFNDAKISVVVTRHNVDQLDEFEALAARYGATLRITRLRPSGRGADVWDELHPTAEQQVQLYDWLVAKGERVLTGDSFFHLSGLGEPGALAGLNLCGAGRVVCLIDPVGDVYACPFAIHDRFLAGNILSDGGFDNVWKNAPLFRELREPQSAGACGSCGHYDSCRGGCMAAKFFTGLPLDGPDPECVQGYGAPALAQERVKPKPSGDHSRGTKQGPIPLTAPLDRCRHQAARSGSVTKVRCN